MFIEHAHESPWLMTVPLIVLAVFSVCVAWGWQPWNPEESFLAEKLSESQPASVIADFGRVETDPLWKGGRLKDDAHNERYLARENHALAGNLALGIVALGLLFAALLYYYRVLDAEESKEQFAAPPRLPDGTNGTLTSCIASYSCGRRWWSPIGFRGSTER